MSQNRKAWIGQEFGRKKGLIRALRKQGKTTYKEIGKMLHCDRNTVRRYDKVYKEA